MKPRMRRVVWLMLTGAVNTILATATLAQTNSFISSTDGFWDEARLWSLAEPPSISQSAILITNAVSETVTIDSITADSFTSTLTVSNLEISPPAGSTNILYLDRAGTNGLHILNSLTLGITPTNSPGDSELISTNSTLIIDGLSGGQLQDNGSMVIISGSLITTNCSLQVAGPSLSFFPSVGLMIISNGITQARDVAIAMTEDSSGIMEVIGGTMTLSSSLSVGNGFGDSEGAILVADGGLLAVTNDETDLGSGVESAGTMIVSNATFLGADVFLGGLRSGGTLTINNGSVTLTGELDLGFGEVAFGSVSLNSGALIVTNNDTTVGDDQSDGVFTVSDGRFFGRAVFVGSHYQSVGALSIQGGVSTLTSNLQIGGMQSFATVSMTGGQLFVTNAPVAISGGFGEVQAQCDVSGGLLAARTIEVASFAEGTLAVDGGCVTVSEGITVGDCNDDSAVGYVSVGGGQLTVTNATGTGFIDIQNGQLNLSSGVLRVDRLVMTNSCSSFMHTGGMLLVGSMVLDPNAFTITSIAREGNDVRVTWMMAPGQTNALQAVCGGSQGVYATNNFADIFVVTNNTTAGCLTNFLDIGAATNTSSRFYRARLSP